MFIIEDRRNDEDYKLSLRGQGFDEKKIKEILEVRRDQLMKELSNQIQEKKSLEARMKSEEEMMPNTGMPIGFEYADRFGNLKELQLAGLKEQVAQKVRKNVEEKSLSKQLGEKYAREMEEFMEKERARRREAESARKDRYKQDMNKFKADYEVRKQREREEKEKELNVLAANRAMQNAEDENRDQVVKSREAAHRGDLKRQMENQKQKKVSTNLY